MKKLTRREMLRLAGLTSFGAALAACAPQATPTAAPEATQAAPEATKAPEATMAPEATATTAPTQAPAKAAPVKITLVESWFGVPQYNESIDPVEKAINDKMAAEGVAVEIASMILENHEQKYPLLYASGADFTMAFDAPWYKMDTLRTQNALSTIDGMVKAAPNLYKEITEKIFNANLIDGKLYGIPAAYYYGGSGGVIYREDLRKKYNAPEPTSKDGWPSLEPFLDAILKNEKGIIPFGNVTTQSLTGYQRVHHGWPANLPPKVGVGIQDFDKSYTLTNMEDNSYYIDIAKILRSWWQKGYVNKTDLTFSGSSQNAQVDYVYPGKIAACVENEPDYKWVDQNKQMKSSNPDAELHGVDMHGDIAKVAKPVGALKQWNFIVFNQAAPKEQMQAGINYFDWLASSQDNMDLWLMGVDGTNYKKAENLRFTEVEGVDAARNYRRQWYVSGLSGRFQRQAAELPQSAFDALTFFSSEENWVFTPYEGFAPDLKALEVDTTKLNAVYDEAVHGLDTGQEDTDAAVAKMKKMLDDNGRKSFIEKAQKQLDDYIAAHK
jgi:putative aldouronate transport system substrate-binding protein